MLHIHHRWSGWGKDQLSVRVRESAVLIPFSILIQHEAIWDQSGKKSGSLLDVWPENYQHFVTKPANRHVPDQSTRSVTRCWQGELRGSVDHTESMLLARRLFKANQHGHERADGMAVFPKTTPHWGHPAKKTERNMQRNWTNLVLGRKSFRKASAQFACHTCAAGSRVNDVVTDGKGRTVWRSVYTTSTQHRKMNLKSESSVYVLAQFFPWYNLVFSFVVYSCPRTKEKKNKFFQGQDWTTASIVRARITANDITRTLN